MDIEFPSWFRKRTCAYCDEEISIDDFMRLGFELQGEDKGKLYVEYSCVNCGTDGIIKFGDEKYNLEKLCTVIIDQSNSLKEAEKIMWKRRYRISGHEDN